MFDNFTPKKTSNEVDQKEPMDFWHGLLHAGNYLKEMHQLATREEATSSLIQRYAFVKDDPGDSLYG